MSHQPHSPRRFRGDFRQSRWVGVRVRPGGFEIDGDVRAELRGRVLSTVRIRKRFEEGILVCRSPDGLRSDEGLLCETCAHPACRPMLRVQLEDGDQIYMLDLPHSSARNLIRLADELAAAGVALASTALVAHVVDRGHWGEVQVRIA